jgi:uncharacterized Zn-finger protein
MANDLSPPVTEPAEILYVLVKRIACDGGGAANQLAGRSAPDGEGALGHPRVFLEMGEGDRVECPYCDRLYVYRAEKAALR